MYQLLENTQTLRKTYQSTLAVYLPKFLSPNLIGSFLQELSELSVRQAFSTKEDVRFTEQIIPKNTNTHRFFRSGEIQRFIMQVIAVDNAAKLQSIKCWTSIYKSGEYIYPHFDKSGTTQLIICLQNGTPENGGELQIQAMNERLNIFLFPGDAVLFAASKLKHSTTTLTATNEVPSPVRKVAVARYYFETVM